MRLFFVFIGFKVKHYKNRGAFKFPCHCEPQARQSPGIKYVILSASEISHRTIVILIIPSVSIPSLRGSVATAAIPSKN